MLFFELSENFLLVFFLFSDKIFEILFIPYVTCLLAVDIRQEVLDLLDFLLLFLKVLFSIYWTLFVLLLKVLKVLLMFLFGYFLLFGLLRGLKFFEPIFKVFVVLRLMLRLLALHFGKKWLDAFVFLCEGSVFPVLLFLKVFDDYQRMIVIELSM